MKTIVITCDVCKTTLSGTKISIIIDDGQYADLCLSCCEKGLSRVITGHEPEESNKIIKMMLKR